MKESARIVIVGGGLAGVEAAIYLRDCLGDRARVTLISPEDHFIFRPFLTYVPFGLSPDRIEIDLAAIAKCHGFSLITGRVDEIRLEKKLVRFGTQSIAYDFLVIATGASPVTEPVPGLSFAHSIWNQTDMMRLRSRLMRLLTEARAGSRARLLFLVPPDSAWTGPLYETAFMTDTWLYWNRVRPSIDMVLATPEASYIEAIGGEMHRPVSEELERHGIEGLTEKRAVGVTSDAVLFDDGSEIAYDLLVSGVSYSGNSPVSALPSDAQGFIRTRLATRQVVGQDEIYAVGDVSDYPVKQGYLALLQADAAAEHICARVEGRPAEFIFDPSALWMMEELDQALLAHGGHEAESSAVAVERIPVGRLRRVQLMGYLPRKSSLGNPLYAGLLWKGTEVGLKILDQLGR